jgi:predicted ATPase
MLMNNWGGVSHKIMEFHEYVNLFSGKSGSGKSTVMDAIQVVLYGSISATFLNKAADDAKNRRSVLSYLRGAQKDGSYNRDGQDFCSQIVLEIFDTGTKVSTCIGVAFEVGKNDTDIRKYKGDCTLPAHSRAPCCPHHYKDYGTTPHTTDYTPGKILHSCLVFRHSHV